MMNWPWEKSEKRRIYLDCAAATPALPEVVRAMERYWSNDFHNPSAIYKEGIKIKEDVKDGRARIAHELGIQSSGIIFTSGGTESDNLAILGSFEESSKTIKVPHLIVSATEHPAVAAAAEEVVRRGGELSILPVNEDGTISLVALEKLLRRDTFLVSIGLANGEIGTIQPISKVARLISDHKKRYKTIYPYLHTDASQAPCFLDVRLENLGADMITLDASKVYGPKGIGLLALRKNVKIHPMIFGGGQENGFRAGTISPALVSGFVIALEKALKNAKEETGRIEILQKRFIEIIRKNLPQVLFNGSSEHHLPNVISISVPFVLSELLVLKLDQEGIMASVGSACSNDGRTSGSPVIRALGKADLSEFTVRFSFGKYTTSREVELAAKTFCKICRDMVK